MNSAQKLLCLAFFLLLPASAASDPLSTAQAEEQALSWIDEQTTEGTIVWPEALTMTPRIVLPWAGGTRVRLEQELLGIKVHGHEVILSYDRSGTLVRTHGSPLRSVLLDPNPAFPLGQAARLAQDAAWLMYGSGTLWPARGELRVVIDGRGVTRLTWMIDVSVADPIGTWRFFFDAHDGSPLHHEQTLWKARGNIYPTNPSVTDIEEADILGITGGGLLGEYAQVRSCANWIADDNNCSEKETHAEADANGDFLYDADPLSFEDPFAEVQMYYHLDRISRWFLERYSFVHNFGIIQGRSIEGIVNFDYNNAFWGDADGDNIGEVAFGQTGSYDYAYDADVIYHEFGHSVFGRIVNPGFIGADSYGVEWATGGLNEGTADLFSLVLTGDPQLGEYAAGGFSLGTSAIRDLEEDRHCPTDLFGESHRDGEIWGALGWNLIQDKVLGPDVTADLIYGAIGTWSSDVNWEQAGQSLVESSTDMLEAGVISQTQHDAIISHGETSGVIGCGRVIALDDDQEPTLYMVHIGFMGDINVPIGNQFSLNVDEYADRMRFRIKDFLRSDANLGWRLHVRRGEPIHHELEALGSFEVPVPTDFDFVAEGTGDDFEYELDLESDPPLEPGATYYFSLASRADGNIQGFAAAEITVDGDVWSDGPPEDESSEDDSGAGCTGCSNIPRAGETTNAAAVFGLLLLGGLSRRRRH
jgi:Zn-dependent metalloprotease